VYWRTFIFAPSWRRKGHFIMAPLTSSALIVRPSPVPLVRVPAAAAEHQAADVTVSALCTHYIFSKRTLLAAGEICLRHFQRIEQSGRRIIDSFGADTFVADLTVSDFTSLRAWLSSRHRTPASITPEIQIVRTIFKFGYDSGLYERPIRFGSDFRRPSAKHFRRERRERGSQMLEAEEIRRLLDAATPIMRAMILLGVNCGFGNSDVGRLPFSALDLEGGWVNFPRPKTEVDRRCPLWPETVKAIRRAIEFRATPTVAGLECLVFISRFGGQWSNGENDSKLSKHFPRLMRRAGIVKRQQRGFYALRRTFETIGGDTGDQPAVDFIMGHAPNASDMAAVYRQRFEDHRLAAVTEYVRRWLCPDKSQIQIDADARRKQLAEEINIAWENVDELTGADVESAIKKLGISQTELAKGVGYSLDWVNTLIRGRPHRTGRTQIGIDADLRFRVFFSQLAEGTEPAPLATDQLRPSFDGPQGFPLSDEAVAALNHHPFTAVELRVLVDCLKESDVIQSTLARWWGCKFKFLRQMLCRRKQIPFAAANRLRELFGLPKVEVEHRTIVAVREKIVYQLQKRQVLLGRLPLTPEVKAALGVKSFGVDHLKVVLNYLHELRFDWTAVESCLGLPRRYLSAAAAGRRKNLCQGLLRRLFDFGAVKGGAQ
jgi:integrase